jgi:hypothetical protein
LTSNLPLMLVLVNFFPHVGFPNHLLENVWVRCAFPYALLPLHDGVEQNTIGVTREQMPNIWIIRVLY